MRPKAIRPIDIASALYREKFDAFAQRAFAFVRPGLLYEWNWHIGCIAEHLEAVYRGELRKLIVNMPPQSLKSFLIATCFPAWIMGKQPHERIICASYSSRLSIRHSQDCRIIVRSEWFKALFPECTIDPNRDQKDLYYTTKNGMRYATSVLGSVTGEGGNYIIIDDPIKPADSTSDLIRTSTNERIEDTFMSRWNDPRIGRFIMVMQRLHEDDATGYLMKKGGYHLLSFPAETKKRITIGLGAKTWEMPENSLLFEKRFTREVLNDLRNSLTEYPYAGQYLQSPSPLGGGEFKEDWIKLFDPYEDKLVYKSFNVYIVIDAAGDGNDWTAMMVIGLAPDNNYYWLDGVRDHFNPTERVNKTFELHRKWNETLGRPPVVGYEKYGMMTDTHYIEEKQKQDNYRFSLIELSGNKADRKDQDIRRLIPDFQRGRWWFPNTMLYTAKMEGRPMQFDLVKEIRNEMRSFPVAKHDDMLDAMSRIYDEKLSATFPKLKQRTVIEKFAGFKETNDWMTM